MRFYCTAGRGTEIFVAAELKQVFGPDVKVTSTDGKSYFIVNDCELDIRQRLLSLKTVERVFAEVLHENFQMLDRRWLLTLLHTKLADKVIWDECMSTLNQVLVPSPLDPQNVNTVDETGNRLSAVSSDTKESCSATKRQKLYCRDIITFRVSCRFSGFARKQLNIQKTSQQMGVLISKLLGWKIDLRHPKHEINIYLNDDTFTVGIPLTNVPLSKRSYIKHCGLRTPIAWIMASQLDIQSGDVVLDSMCGTGTILLEASHICKKAVYIGMDKDISQLKLAAENIVHNKMKCCFTLLHGDTRYLPLPDSCIDKVVTDAPFGQSHTVTGDLHMFYDHFLTEIARVVKPGGKIVILTSTCLAHFLQQVCDRSARPIHHQREQPPHLAKGDTETVQEDSETSLSNITAGRTEAADKLEDKTWCNDRDSDWSSSVNLILKASYNVKLGETEGCVFVMLNSEKLKHF